MLAAVTRSTRVAVAYLTLAFAGVSVCTNAQDASAPVGTTAQEDHQRMKDLLGITSLRPGADPNNPQSPHAVNYDESKANPYPSFPMRSC